MAVWGSSGLGVSTGHLSLQKGFQQAINDQGETKLGMATLAGKMELFATGFHLDILDTYILFGDPALKMNFTVVPYTGQLYLPIVLR